MQSCGRLCLSVRLSARACACSLVDVHLFLCLPVCLSALRLHGFRHFSSFHNYVIALAYSLYYLLHSEKTKTKHRSDNNDLLSSTSFFHCQDNLLSLSSLCSAVRLTFHLPSDR